MDATTQPTRFARGIFLAYTSFVALCAFFILLTLFLSPSEAGSAIFLGLSAARLVLAMGFLAVFLLFAVLFVKALVDRAWAERTHRLLFGSGRLSRGIAWLAAIGLGLGWIGCFLPPYRAGPLEPHWDRVQPVMVFILLASLATLFVFLIGRIDLSSLRIRLRAPYRLALLLFLVCLLLASWMFYSRYGIYAPPEDFWYGAGVPLLVPQLVAAVLGGVLFMLVRWNWNAGRKDLLVALVLYAIAAVLWAREPLQKSFLFTPPRPPNEVLYPFADAAAFDAGSQFALIGQGIFIFGNPFTDRPLYLSHLVYLHSLFGQNYDLLMAVQAAIFAVLPALIYLIGRSLHMRPVGFAAALVAMFRGANSIAASSLIDLANPKMILSDFPAAIGVALIILATCEWLKKPDQRAHYAIWVGGAIGLTLMIRPHALMFLVLIPVYALLNFRFQWKRWLLACVLIGLGVIAFTLPWELRTMARGGVMYRSLVIKIQDVIRTRYAPASQQGSIFPGSNFLSPVTFQQGEILASLYRQSNTMQEPACNSILCFTPKHFLHNTLMSFLSLPTSPMLSDLWHLTKEVHPYWRADWDGNISGTSLLLIAMNLFLVVLGISVVWRHQRFTGLFPLAAFVIYNLSNSLARTSGGRYIVPIDWIISIYFMAGILFLIADAARFARIGSLSILDMEEQPEDKTSTSRPLWRRALPVLAVLFLAGSLVPLSEKLHSPRYAGFDIPATLQRKEAQIRQVGLDPEQIKAFLQTPGAEALVGRTLYPRSYKMGQGEVSFYFYPFTSMEFPRTGFFLIGPGGQNNILLPGKVPDHLPHAADALVIGCREQNYVDALMVIMLDESGAVYTRSPMAKLACPMPLPVCENNNTCK